MKKLNKILLKLNKIHVYFDFKRAAIKNFIFTQIYAHIHIHICYTFVRRISAYFRTQWMLTKIELSVIIRNELTVFLTCLLRWAQEYTLYIELDFPQHILWLCLEYIAVRKKETEGKGEREKWKFEWCEHFPHLPRYEPPTVRGQLVANISFNLRRSTAT